MPSNRVPKFLEDAIFAGAGEGQRNDRAFWVAAQARDARIPRHEAEAMIEQFAARCNPPLNKGEALNAVASAYRAAPREEAKSPGGPKSGGAYKPRAPFAGTDDVIDWEGVIGPAAEKRAAAEAQGSGAPDFVEEVPAPSGNPAADLRAWLAALYQPDDLVNYMVTSFQDEDTKYKPLGKGATRSRSDIEAGLDKYEAKGYKGDELLRMVLGDWKPDAGVWARINPLDGEGVFNNNVVRLDHVLVEGDEQPIEKQLAIIRSLRIPCAAIVHSGAKSIHAIVRVGAGTDKALYAERVAALFKTLDDAGLKVDVKCRNSSRLSRLPGPSRAGKPQYLVAGPSGAKNWDSWQAEREASDFRSDAMGPDDLEETPPADSLVGDRFLCRGGAWVVVAQSGAGKSVLAMQAAMSFAAGRPFFGLATAGATRNLMIQAENNRGDMHETFVGIKKGLLFDLDEKALLRENFRTVHCSRYTGAVFCEFLAHQCRLFKPDIVWVDPLLAFLGGEISKMGDTARFLRNQLQPVIEDNNIGVVVIHHTGKPPKSEEGKYKGADLAYLGIGSSDITNWARATSTLLRMEGCDNRFTFEHAKRGGRAGCKRATEIMHASGGDIYWTEAGGKVTDADRRDIEARKHGRDPAHKTYCQPSKYDGLGFEQMPPLKGGREAEQSPAVLWIAEVLEKRGFPESPAKVKNIMRTLERLGFIHFDTDRLVWHGSMHDFTQQ